MTGLSHESLENAYAVPAKALEKLADSVESREAKRLLAASEQVAHVAREKAPREEES